MTTDKEIYKYIQSQIEEKNLEIGDLKEEIIKLEDLLNS